MLSSMEGQPAAGPECCAGAEPMTRCGADWTLSLEPEHQQRRHSVGYDALAAAPATADIGSRDSRLSARDITMGRSWRRSATATYRVPSMVQTRSHDEIGTPITGTARSSGHGSGQRQTMTSDRSWRS